MQTEAGNNAFDRELRDKLSQLRPEYRPDSWERMAAHLDAAESSPDFDEAVAERMRQLEVPYQAASWNALSARLDAEDEIEAFDEAVHQGLRRVQPYYQPSSWKALAARLELERQRIRTVLHYKTMELSLLLLLFLTAWQHLPFEPKTPPSSPEQAGYPIAQLTTPEQGITTAKPFTKEAHAPFAAEDEENIPAFTETTPTLPTTKRELPTKTNGASPNWSGIVAGAHTPLAEISPLPSSSPELLPTPLGPQDRLTALRAEKAQALTSPADKVIEAGAMTALHTGAPALLDYGEPEELLHYIRPSERKTFVRIGFFGGPDYNRIVTPPQRIEDGTIYTSSRYTLGYSGGITIGVEHNERWELETGLVYAARRYQAIPTVFVTGSIKDGFSGYSLQDFELNTFSAPLNFRYNFLVHDKWRIYTQVGAALNVVTQANYYAVDESAFSSLRQASGLDENNGISSASKPEILKSKSFNQGWLDGGNFWENATLYGNLGLGIERYMTSDWGMFVQPHYQHALPFFNDGLGPYEDKIHNFSIRMGLKVRL